jgi:hypothetical protein
MSDFTLVSSVCLHHSCTLVYRSADGQIGLVIQSGGRKQDRRRYFLWALPDSAPDYATAAEARQALLACTPQEAPHA